MPKAGMWITPGKEGINHWSAPATTGTTSTTARRFFTAVVETILAQKMLWNYMDASANRLPRLQDSSQMIEQIAKQFFFLISNDINCNCKKK